MTNLIDLRLGGMCDATTAPFVRRLLPGCAKAGETIHVDVRVRSYDPAPPLAPRACGIAGRTGRLPVGTLLDCYL